MSHASRTVVEGSQAVAEAVRQCKPGVVAVYPITPQTHIAETLAEMVADGRLDTEMIRVESEQSAMAACIGSQATGVRSYTATASQGLALMHEILFIASGMRLPIVMTVANRSLSAPLSIWNDQQDSFASRDSGWIQLYVENAQEAYDTHIQAFRIAQEAENPVMVCLDGYLISHVYENVKFIKDGDVERFLPEYRPRYSLNPKKPVTMGSLGTPQYYMLFKKQQEEALEASKEVIKRVNAEFSKTFGRCYGNGLIETINLDGSDFALITIGSVTGTVREVAKREGIGIIRVRSLRPFPKEDVQEACRGLKSIGVIEKDISFGSGGALYHEIKSALYSLDERPVVSSFIAGIGGRDITLNAVESIIKKVKSGSECVEWVL
ncbi:MAG TPA: pyruvate ferredoxin oxidoreductase [Candidatus Aenigmarchaeota archaeon]|nr:pyruvate ferredoxin oxidoreductase [Candidatus Aenigmarchaeota archaeon]